MMAKRVIHKDDGGARYVDREKLTFHAYCGIASQRTSVYWRNVTCKNCLRLRPKKGK